MRSAETRYARNGDLHIAYQIVGIGDIDLVYVPSWVSHVELAWDVPEMARFLSRLGSFSRLIWFDKRGTGLSDPVPIDRLPTLEQRMDDLRIVMDAAGSQRAAIFGASEGGNLSALFAATHPDRTSALILYGSFAKRIRCPEYPWAPTLQERENAYDDVERNWGCRFDMSRMAPSKVGDDEFNQRFSTYLRRSASPGAAIALLRMNTQIDIREVLPVIDVPTLVIHRTGDRDSSVEEGRWVARRIPRATFVELPGVDHPPWIGDQDAVLNVIQEFLTGEQSAPEVTRVLTTILFTDIVGSTRRIHQIGDHAWKDLLDQHDLVCHNSIDRFRGRLIKQTGDGVHATFDGPGRAINCAREIVQGCRKLDIEIRAGIHTGECELRGHETEGLAVHLAARIASLANSGQVLVSRTVCDLVAGAGFEFDDQGDHEFRGFSDKCRVFSVKGCVFRAEHDQESDGSA